MKGRRTVPSHEHKSFDIRPLGECRACDDYYERRGLTGDEIEASMIRLPPKQYGLGIFRLLRMLGDVDPDRHAEVLGYIKQGQQLADQVDDAMGDWPGRG